MITHCDDYTITTWHPLEGAQDIEFYLDYDHVRYFGWAFTLQGVQAIMARWQLTGEQAGGGYFWATDFFILANLSMPALQAALDDIVAGGHDRLNQMFSRIEQAPENDAT